ncbi:hypothetical protein [Terrihabitans rhizophilus]|uniref:SH3 domain-containing protein n=1 Tax=Terrihabitans rhizophilus TaxID=3092662 RepID=A0ABU4RMU5_9HYPH|nr:hypothetical protein [Terrihabitans sp. PJ23]MDX6806149.1 hypothetical protein [Terrihabitans sp. PJ23]
MTNVSPSSKANPQSGKIADGRKAPADPKSTLSHQVSVGLDNGDAAKEGAPLKPVTAPQELPAERTGSSVEQELTPSSQIKKGDTVLAADPEDGWFEASVVGEKGNEQLILRWRDWPLELAFTKPHTEVALLPSATETSKRWEIATAGLKVLAFDQEFEGWYEATIVEDQGTRLSLRWVADPDDPVFFRTRDFLAFMPSAKS